jgi:hypothetical protein
MSEDRDGFEINGRFYPWVQQMRIVDPPLIVEVTGLKYNDFLREWQDTIAKAADAEEHGEQLDPLDIDPIVMNGLIAVAIWQQHTDWSRQKVVRYLERLNQADVEIVGGDEPDEEDKQTDPLSDGDSGSTGSVSSSTTHSPSNGSQESPSEAIPPSTGLRMSVTSSQGSHPQG